MVLQGLGRAYVEQFLVLDHLMDTLEPSDEDWELCNLLRTNMNDMMSLTDEMERCSAADADFVHVQRACQLWHPFSSGAIADAFCQERLGFSRVADVQRLVHLLRVPEVFILSNQSKVAGEHAFMIALLRLRSTGPNAALESHARMERTQISRTFRAFVDWLVAWISDLPSSSLPWYRSRAKLYNDAFLAHFEKAGEECPAHGRDIIAFIDGTGFRINRPTDTGEYAGMDLQNACYNAKGNGHFLRFSGMTAMDGLIMDLIGPVGGSRHDGFLLAVGKFHERFAHAFPAGHKVFGDAAYAVDGIISRQHRTPSGQLLVDNMLLGKRRIVVEWSFGDLANLFPLLSCPRKLSLMSSPLAHWFRCGVFLMNCHTCLYGGNCAKYFDVMPPTLDEFLGE